ncbi:MAG: hypothetical protein ABJN26_25190 [Stappiaceae bacterium]
MTIEIETDVPLPQRHGRKSGRYAIYPWYSMKPGDSFRAEKEKLRSISSCASRVQRDNEGMRFTVKVIGEEVRCWRVS